MSAQAPVIHRGIIKQVLSGDAVIIRGQPKGGPPPERQLCLSNITAPRLARRAGNNSAETKDEPWAWEAREYLRSKCIGKEIAFTVEYKVPGTGREYGCVYLGSNAAAENVTEGLVERGLVEVRRAGIKASDESQQKLVQLEDQAKASGVGKWAENATNENVREVKWNLSEPRKFVDQCKYKPMKAVIEHVRDGCTVRAFLLPSFQYVTVMLSGVKAPMTKQDGTTEPYAAEAKFFVESRLLQRDVEIILEGVSNVNLLGTVLHPKGNITEMLLKEGYARCVDWSLGIVTQGVDKYRAAEKVAKDAKLRMWKNYTESSAQKDFGSITEREYTGKVVEVLGGDSMMIKSHTGSQKVFLSSVRPPRPVQTGEDQAADPRKKIRERSRPLYDTPYLFEAREFLRKKLIGKRVNVKVDYVQPAQNNFPEKVCCTVNISGSNVAEALVSKGLATVIRYRQNDDSRSSHYDELLSAEARAQKKAVGLHSTSDAPIHRIADMTTGDAAKAKQFLPFLIRQEKCEALVEFVASGSRVRLYMPKETCLLTLLLGGISCPRGARPAPGPSGQMLPAEPFGPEAQEHTRDLCLQREVVIKVDSMDKAGNFIGWMFVDGVNVSVSLVENGLARLHFSAENSQYFKQLEVAENSAKQAKLGLWASYVEEIKDAVQEVDDSQAERTKRLDKVICTEVSETELSFFTQKVENGPKFETFMAEMRADLQANPPLAGAYTPKRGEVCVAKFVDDLWYRAKVLKVDKENNATVQYIDYGNTGTVPATKTGVLPAAFASMPPQAREYRLALVQLPSDEEFCRDALDALFHNINNKVLSLNVEYKGTGGDYVSIYQDDEGAQDVGLSLVEDGYLLVEKRRERRLQKLVTDYVNAQNSAKKNRMNLWQYGDITEDDAREFGMGR